MIMAVLRKRMEVEDMKEVFVCAQLELFLFQTQDVITSSNVGENELEWSDDFT